MAQLLVALGLLALAAFVVRQLLGSLLADHLGETPLERGVIAFGDRRLHGGILVGWLAAGLVLVLVAEVRGYIDLAALWRGLPRLPLATLVIFLGLAWWSTRTVGTALFLAHLVLPRVTRPALHSWLGPPPPVAGTPVSEVFGMTFSSDYIMASAASEFVIQSLLVLAVIYLLREARQGFYTLPAAESAVQGSGTHGR